jgi:hypothetical protein
VEARQFRALLKPLIACSVWAQPATVVAARQVKELFYPLFDLLVWSLAATVMAGATGDGAALASVRYFGVGSASHCGGGHDT